MISNFEVLMDFKNVRDFAICMSKNNICCHKDKARECYSEIRPSKMQDSCRRCWLDFLTSDEGLDLSYLDKVEELVKESKEVRCWKCGKVLTEENISKKMYTSFPPKYSCKDCD